MALPTSWFQTLRLPNWEKTLLREQVSAVLSKFVALCYSSPSKPQFLKSPQRITRERHHGWTRSIRDYKGFIFSQPVNVWISAWPHKHNCITSSGAITSPSVWGPGALRLGELHCFGSGLPQKGQPCHASLLHQERTRMVLPTTSLSRAAWRSVSL